ncbi:hypothetical protein M153_4611000528 [Pseudoloma neurophilia]|uniref:Uncharacterized protein n=1 Tax=Pseudoloma neurophilia TaxID=146866 RepID=A0A0R0LST7_9MICR|nr:hypothetical protein M153_4611000528 [Pseudoloma neurophilia]
MEDSRSSEYTSDTSEKSIFFVPHCDDPIVEQGLYAKKFSTIKEKYLNNKDERIIFRGCSEFYIFLKNAYYVLEEHSDYIKFCLNLNLDDSELHRYKMSDFLSLCASKVEEPVTDIQQTFLQDDFSGSFIKTPKSKNRSRVSFNLDRNEIKYYLEEQSNLHHGNYTKLDKKEGQVLKSDAWLHPVQIKQKTPFKTKSTEIHRKQNVVKIPSGPFVTTENLITDLISNNPIELTLTNLNLKNEFHNLQKVRNSFSKTNSDLPTDKQSNFNDLTQNSSEIRKMQDEIIEKFFQDDKLLLKRILDFVE